MKEIIITVICAGLITQAHTKKLERCLDIEQAHIEKHFKSTFFKNEIYFPIGNKMDYGADTIEPHPTENEKSNDHYSKQKCFSVTLHSETEGEFSVPFICQNDPLVAELCCRLETRGSGIENFGLWGWARVAKTDNKSFLLVVTCVSHKKPSWILLHKDPTIKETLRNEILDSIELLGFDRNELSSKSDPVTLIKMKRQAKC